jgi:hypothetical protein
MLAAIDGLPGCRFVTVPDVVGDHDATLELWNEWQGSSQSRAQPPAFVLQDGVTLDDVPFAECGRSFHRGVDRVQTRRRGPRDASREARLGRLWVHMGRVNSERRIRYAASIGCDSVDGSSWAQFKEVHLRRGLQACAAAAAQLGFEVGS